MALFWGDASFTDDFTGRFSIGEGGLAFSTLLSGYMEYSLSPFSGGKRKTPAVSVHPCALVFSGRDCEGSARMYAGDPYRFVSVTLSPSILEEILPSSDLPAACLDEMTKIRKGIHLYKMSKLSPPLRTVATQIIACPMDGMCRSLFIEGKVLEFLSLHINKITSKKDIGSVLTRSDIEKLHAARKILADNIFSPPCIHELSSLCGLNEFKLKKGFTGYFGNTVYGLLRKERMRHARALLRDSDTSVNIVANAVGYSNISHFIAAFRNEFGMTPGEILKNARRRVVRA